MQSKFLERMTVQEVGREGARIGTEKRPSRDRPMLAKTRPPVTDPLGPHLDYLRTADDPRIDPVYIEPNLTLPQVTASENSNPSSAAHPTSPTRQRPPRASGFVLTGTLTLQGGLVSIPSEAFARDQSTPRALSVELPLPDRWRRAKGPTRQ